MNNELTPENFITKIKMMAKRDRSKITAEKLIELICQMSDPPTVDEAISNQLAELRTSIQHINQKSSVNQTEIASLKIENAEYAKKNLEKNLLLSTRLDLLDVHAQECKQHRETHPTVAPQPPNGNQAEIKRLHDQITELQREINSIQQYLRVNNLEVVGLPESNDGEYDETLLINALNELEGLDIPVRPEDIDISHPLKSNRKDNKPVHVVRFVSRKTKFQILAAKKREQNKQFKFRNNDVYINEHLSPQNRALFGAAQDKKRALNYKYCWTRGGTIHMRKTDESVVVKILSNDDLDNLVQ